MCLLFLSRNIEERNGPGQLVPAVGERLEAWEVFLELLPGLFPVPAPDAPVLSAPHAFGAAVQAAYESLKLIGGKAVVFSCSRATAGWGSLRVRDDPRAMGTAAEAAQARAVASFSAAVLTEIYLGNVCSCQEILRRSGGRQRAPAGSAYAELGDRCADAHVSIDYVLMAAESVDLFTCAQTPLSCLGRVYHWPGYNPRTDGPTLHSYVARLLSRPTGWEGVGRVRVSEGLRIGRHFGAVGALRHGTDVRLPVLDADTAFAVEMDYDGTAIVDGRAYVQSAYLYTTSEGHRRIRVSTSAAAVSPLTSTLFRAADCEAVLGLACRQACGELCQEPISVIRDRLTMTCVDILAAYRQHCTSNPASGQLILPETLKHLPLYTLSMLRCAAFSNEKVAADRRAAAVVELASMPAAMSGIHFYPRMYKLNELLQPTAAGAAEIGEVDASGRVRMPPMLRLSTDSVEPDGIYLVEDGMQVLMWIGAAASPQILQLLFGGSWRRACLPPPRRLTPCTVAAALCRRCRQVRAPAPRGDR
jgi:protein transport protein SEC24